MFHGAAAMALHGLQTAPFWLALAGVVAAYYCYMINPRVPAWFYAKFKPLHTLLDNKYYMDKFNQKVFAGGALLLGGGLWKVGDRGLIDGLVVNGSAKVVGWFSTITRTSTDRLHLPLCVRDDRWRAGDPAVLLPVLARLITGRDNEK